MTEMKKINAEALENVAGGVILFCKDEFWVYTDDGIFCVKEPFKDVDAAEASARKIGVSDVIYSPREFEARYGKRANP